MRFGMRGHNRWQVRHAGRFLALYQSVPLQRAVATKPLNADHYT